MSGPRLKLALEYDSTSRGRHVRDIVSELKRQHWVRGALIVAADGFVIAAELPGTIEVDSMAALAATLDRKSTRLNSSHVKISYAVFCLKKKTKSKLLH